MFLTRVGQIPTTTALALIMLFCYFLPACAVTIQDVQQSMGVNEAALLKAPNTTRWSKGAMIGMGNRAQGSATPVWWKPHNLALKNDDYWYAITPWFVVYPSVHHRARDTRFQLANIKVFIYSKSQQRWHQINLKHQAIHWAAYYQHQMGVRVEKIPLQANTQQTFALHPELYPIHGGTAKLAIDPLDIQEVFVSVESQLLVDDTQPADNTHPAELLVSIGADYYPTLNSTLADFAPMSFVPAVGASRFEVIQQHKRVHTFTSFNFTKCGLHCAQDPVYISLSKLVNDL